MSAATRNPKSRLRLLQFRLRTFLIATALVTVAFAWPHIQRQYAVWKVKQYAGRPLHELPEEERAKVNRWLGRVVQREEEHDRVWWQDWLVHACDTPAGRRMYIVQMAPTMSIPGRSLGRVYVLNGLGRIINSTEFNVGYRAFPQQATMYESPHGFVCLAVTAELTWRGATRQFYRITDEFVELVRSEQLDGTFNMGYGNGYELDDKPRDWPKWRELLASPRELDQLRGLAAFWSWENLQAVQKGLDEGTKRRLSELCSSSEPWIREEAIAALKYIDGKR